MRIIYPSRFFLTGKHEDENIKDNQNCKNSNTEMKNGNYKYTNHKASPFLHASKKYSTALICWFFHTEKSMKKSK